MSTMTDAEAAAAPSALAEAARMAGLAPSIHNTQPWHWRVVGSNLELLARRERQLEVTDPTGRLLTVSCGAALHHVTTALAAEGWAAQVHRVPDPARPDLLAVVTLTGRIDVNPRAMRDLQMLRVRHTDRRPVSDVAPTPAAIEDIAAAAGAAGAQLHRLRPDDVIGLAAAAARAQRVETGDPAWQAELAYWAGGTRADGLGVPDDVIPHDPPQTTVPGRYFGHEGRLAVGAGHDGAAVYLILYGDHDTPAGWLRGGEALSAAWVCALEHGLTLLPLSGVVEVASTRQELRRLLSGIGEPYLVLRLGAPDPDEAGPPHTPRLPADQIVEIVRP